MSFDHRGVVPARIRKHRMIQVVHYVKETPIRQPADVDISFRDVLACWIKRRRWSRHDGNRVRALASTLATAFSNALTPALLANVPHGWEIATFAFDVPALAAASMAGPSRFSAPSPLERHLP